LYKLLLCWRYLLTRYLALVCIVSVMLGVATLIVVNSVMAGFSTKLRNRLHGLLSDVVIEAYDYNGMPDYEGKMEKIRSDPYLSDQVEAMTPTLEIFAMLQFYWRGTPMMRTVRVIGIEPEGRTQVGGFAEYLEDHQNRPREAFTLSNQAFGHYLENNRFHGMALRDFNQDTLSPDATKPPPAPPPSRVEDMPDFIILGHAMAHFRERDAADELATKEIATIELGDEVTITTVSGQRLRPVNDRLVVCDYFKSEMSEYDGSYVFVPLAYLQKLRTTQGRATSIQIKLKNYDHAKEVVGRLRKLFDGQPVFIQTWEDKQGPLLSAIAVEKGILNVLLFLIILVAGFGILAIFSMIVIEKTRDIGIMKALGASNGGVLKIFLSYGLLLGTVGSSIGTVIGVLFTIYINEIEWGLSRLTGQTIFPRTTYYFDTIPTDIQPISVVLVNVGAILIAVMFSVLPALRAATLHPVRALRYE
jgi:lipoprotein-releasing system permease protein